MRTPGVPPDRHGSSATSRGKSCKIRAPAAEISLTSSTPTEPILEPDLPIIDPHHHLWDWPAALLAARPAPEHAFTTVVRRANPYLLPELLADLNTGHNVRATVFVQCGAMYRADGPEGFKPVGETEFVNGVAAMCASGTYGPVRACAGIVGHADLTAGAIVREVLEAHLKTAGERFRGIRHSASYDADSRVLGPLVRVGPGLFAQKDFREGYAQLGKLNLSFDAWLLEPQLPELIDLAQCFPGTPVILDHVGTPLGIAAYQGRRERTLSNLAREHHQARGVAKRSGQARRPCHGLWQFPVFFAISLRLLNPACCRMAALH